MQWMKGELFLPLRQMLSQRQIHSLGLLQIPNSVFLSALCRILHWLRAWKCPLWGVLFHEDSKANPIRKQRKKWHFTHISNLSAAIGWGVLGEKYWRTGDGGTARRIKVYLFFRYFLISFLLFVQHLKHCTLNTCFNGIVLFLWTNNHFKIKFLWLLQGLWKLISYLSTIFPLFSHTNSFPQIWKYCY